MSSKQTLNLFLLLSFLTIVYGQVLDAYTSELHKRFPGGPLEGGIVRLELAGLRGEMPPVLRSLSGRDEAGHQVAGDLRYLAYRQLWWDFVFLFLYPAALGLGCLLARNRFEKWPWAKLLGLILARAQIVAGLFDAGENLALLRVLGRFGEGETHLP
ncbi:MAG: hypothetical protein KDD47_26615, partial [Acidobacteria bacterium]|nr:hypothetical protein [Acidobacteriota bacterium]